MSNNDQDFIDSLYDYMHVLHGRKYTLVLNSDQRVRSSYVEAARHACIFCDGKQDQIGKYIMPERLWHMARFVLYTVCAPCFRLGNVQNRAEKAILDSLEH